MRSVAHKQNQTTKPNSSGFFFDDRAKHSAARRDISSHVPADVTLNAAPSSYFCRDFTRIPTHPPLNAVLQAKLRIGQAGDEYEREADQVSDKVVGMAPPQLQRKCACGRK